MNDHSLVSATRGFQPDKNQQKNILWQKRFGKGLPLIYTFHTDKERNLMMPTSTLTKPKISENSQVSPFLVFFL